MSNLIGVSIVVMLLACGATSYANPDAIVIPNGDLRIKGAGSGPNI
jgi:hypothetical protein